MHNWVNVVQDEKRKDALYGTQIYIKRKGREVENPIESNAAAAAWMLHMWYIRALL